MANASIIHALLGRFRIVLRVSRLIFGRGVGYARTGVNKCGLQGQGFARLLASSTRTRYHPGNISGAKDQGTLFPGLCRCTISKADSGMWSSLCNVITERLIHTFSSYCAAQKAVVLQAKIGIEEAEKRTFCK